MVIIYTTPSCSSCRKAKKWLLDHEIEFEEINLFNHTFTSNDIIDILEKTDFGFDEIISNRSKIIKEGNINVDELTINELLEFIQENPSILRRPIIVDKNRLLIGYNDEEIETFLPRDAKKCSVCGDKSCGAKDKCEYTDVLEKLVKKLK